MNREIKFRLFEESTAKMFTWDEIICNQLLMCATFEIGPSLDFITMQYTGTKDKNGTEIYVGDILRYESMEYEFYKYNNYLVEFGKSYEDGGKATFVGFYIKENIPPYRFDRSSILFEDSSIEILGNIHENPELLQEQK